MLRILNKSAVKEGFMAILKDFFAKAKFMDETLMETMEVNTC
ncbi:MAG: hypothetical protein QMC83_01645 [Thermodesulfovibrionales bacterium]|nr:hypothetical protein [Thermodesulfovibrionales bacterium]